ncbi:WD repeat-containing protein 6 [Biomphalaria pfeifferi]|uniref:tRNA (34-2'-O)-methyltransferase regulator WDR6 n=1 Tax=Biomphalaria pfeifferi TaxID=112525 RepID=A0AAD8FCB8_BIOPF|nr:WD repeat-containing protein 6 [Biomphalaria pfeifferi]
MSKSNVIELENYTGPVTALLIVKDCIVSGCGNEISVYDLNTFHLQSRRQILHGATVHGIRKGPAHTDGSLLCVFGGKQACVVFLKKENKDVSLSTISAIIHVDDWIWDIQWLTGEKDETSNLVIALAHNSVVKYQWKTGEIIERRECTEKCILYTACFIGQQWSNLILAAGTVFNQIVLWSVACKLEQKSLNPKTVDPILTLSGHKGVIFSMRYHSQFQRICSVSDDRSIRMWQLKFPSGSTMEPTIEDWESVQSTLLLSVFGHSARVWDVALLSACFISIAEDAVCLVWDYHGNILKIFKGHKGRSIWSLAVSADEQFVLTGGGDASIRQWKIDQLQEKETTQAIIEIGEHCNENAEDFPRSVQLLNFDTILIMMNSGRLYFYKVCNQHFHLIAHDTKFRSYSILTPCPNETTVAIGTISGTLNIIHFLDEDEIITSKEDLYKGKVLDVVWLDHHHIVISGPDGICILLKVEVSEDKESNSHIAMTVQKRLFLPAAKHRWISAACFVPTQVDVEMETLVCGDKDGSVLLYNLNNKSNADIVEPDQMFVKVHGKAGTTFVGHRDGYIYSAGRDGFYRQWQIQDGSLVQLHGCKVVKSFEWIEKLEWNQDDLLVYGFLSSQFVVWSVNYNQLVMAVVCGGGHRSWGCSHEDGVMRFVYLKAASIYMVDRGHLSKQTIVQPALHGREVCDVKFLHTIENELCGLVHIVCSASEDNTINIIMFSKKSGYICWSPLTTIKGHLSSVRAITVSSKIHQTQLPHQCDNSFVNKDQKDDIHFLIFSGGGRAEIRAWKLKLVRASEPKSDQLVEIESNSYMDMRKKGQQETFQEYSSKNGKIFPSMADPFTCSYEHLSTHFLGESRHKQQYSSWKTHRLCLDPETRIMSLAASPLLDLVNCSQEILLATEGFSNYHVLSAAGSDGNFRVFLFDERCTKLKLLLKSAYHHGCVLKVVHYSHKTSGLNISFAFSASTNGHIVVWSLGDLLDHMTSQLFSRSLVSSNVGITTQSEPDNSESSAEEEEDGDYTDFSIGSTDHVTKEERSPCCVFSANQSGINSLHALQISDSRLLVASGGDDNAVCVHLLELDNGSLKLVAKGIKPDAHAAQITAIWLVSSNLLISASIDQRINVWSIQCTENNLIEFQMLASKYINIANVTNMDVQVHRDSVYVYIGGEGICLYKIQLDPIKSTCQND